MVDDKVFESEIENLLAKIGISLLEFSVSRHRGSLKVKAVIYSAKGTGTDECTKAYRLMLPRIQLSYGNQNPEIEVASPGIDRIIRTDREWNAFIGKAVRVLPKDGSEWSTGILESHENGSVRIRNRNGTETWELSSLAKARLDSEYKGE